MERANQTVKRYLQKFKDIHDIQERVSKALFVLNYLCIFGESEAVPAKCHAGPFQGNRPTEMKVYYRDLSTGQWSGPAVVQYIGKGCMCVLTPTGTQCIPAKWTKAALESAHVEDDHEEVPDGHSDDNTGCSTSRTVKNSLQSPLSDYI